MGRSGISYKGKVNTLFAVSIISFIVSIVIVAYTRDIDTINIAIYILYGISILIVIGCIILVNISEIEDTQFGHRYRNRFAGKLLLSYMVIIFLQAALAVLAVILYITDSYEIFLYPVAVSLAISAVGSLIVSS